MNVLISIQQPVRAWQIPVEGVDTLRRRFPEIVFDHATDDEARARALAECDIAYTWIMSAAELAVARRLKWVHTSAVAVETLALPELFARGVIVSNTRGVQSTPIAEHVFAVLLGLAKQLPFVLENQRARRWAQNDFFGTRLPWLLRGRTLGLIGVGTIGAEIARLGAAFGMRVLALRRRAGGAAIDAVDEMLGPGELDSLLQRSDVLVIAAPLTPETLNMIGVAQIERMKQGAVLINVGRAKIVDHLALADALHSGHLGGASFDVFHQEPLPADDPLWSAPNTILTPHTSGFRQGHWDEVIELFADNLSRFLCGEPVRFRIDPALGY
jgi:phosphoglycerate dehydrogenase-like enzyme